MVARTRTRSGGQYYSGRYRANALSWTTRTRSGSYRQTTADEVGDFTQDNPFLSERWTLEKCATIPAGAYRISQFTTNYVEGDLIPTYFGDTSGGSQSFPVYLSERLAEPSVSTLVTKGLAVSNPNRPTLDLPVFAFELKDLPRMIKQAGDAIRWYRSGKGGVPSPIDLANANLSYQMGWAPLASDLLKLFGFVDAVERVRRNLTALNDKGGLRRNVKVFSSEDTATFLGGRDSVNINTVPSGTTVVGTRVRSRTLEAWVSVRWKPKELPPGPNSPTDWQVFKNLLGLDITIATVWEALPWSWLVDYFSNVGDFFGAHRNSIPVTHSRVNLMLKHRNVLQYSRSSGQLPAWGGATVVYERKQRIPHSGIILPHVSLPFLGAKQLSILGSLLIVRSGVK